MDGLYMTGLPDSLTLQEMLDCDIKTEMDVDECFSLGELPPLALEDSLDSKWEFIDSTNGLGNGLLFSRQSLPLHSPGSDMTMWFNGSSSSHLNSALDMDPAALMVNPSSVMPVALICSPTPPPPATVATPTPTVTTTPSVVTPVTRAKITTTTTGINIVCSQNSPFTILRTSTINSNGNNSTLAHADSNTISIRSPAPRKMPNLSHAEVKAFPKPAYSYSCLIALALKNSQTGSLPVSEIYNFMCEHFPYFKTAPNGWKNSVRHNLSLNKCFEKIEKPTGNGNQRKGCLWAMNPAKVPKMDEEVQKWSKKDPAAIRRAMISPEHLEMLERGEMKRELPSSSTLSGEDSEEEEEQGTPPSPPREQPFTPPSGEDPAEEDDPIGCEFVDISELEQLGENSLSEFDLDVTEGFYEDLEDERLNLGINITTPKVQASYICKPSSTSTTVRIRKVAPILLSTNKRQHL